VVVMLKKLIWSQSPCGITQDGNPKYWAVGGTKLLANRFPDKFGQQCVANTRKGGMGVRCCFDNLPTDAAPRCKICPSGSSSSAGSVGEESCTCDNGWATTGGCVLPAAPPSPTPNPTPNPTMRPTKTPETCTAGKYRTGSVRGCNELGFPKSDFRNSAGGKTCGTTRISGSCPAPTDYESAKALCEANDMRLCRNKAEVRASVFQINDKCDAIAGNKVWVERPCRNGTIESAYAVGMQPTMDSDVCLEKTRNAVVACCADTNRGTYCANCPKNSNSNDAAVGIEDCSCNGGYYYGSTHSTSSYCVVAPPTDAPTASPTAFSCSLLDEANCASYGDGTICRWRSKAQECAFN